MQPETLLVALGEEDIDRTDAIANAVNKIAAPADARVVVAHVLSETEYERAAENLSISTQDTTGLFTVTPMGGAIFTPPERSGSGQSLAKRDVLETVLNQKKSVQNFVDELDDTDIEYEVRGDVGDPAALIVEIADELGVDFVVVGGRDQTPARQALFGSVSQEIIRSVDCPVVTVRDDIEE